MIKTVACQRRFMLIIYHVPITLRLVVTPIPLTIHWLYLLCCWRIMKISNPSTLVSNLRYTNLFSSSTQLFVYSWDSTGWYFYIRGTALDQKLLVSAYLIYYRLTEILVWRHGSSTTRWLVKSLLLTGQIFMPFCH